MGDGFYVRKPRPLTILLHGRKEVLKPWNLPTNELIRVRDWLEDVLVWRDGQVQKACDYGWDSEAVHQGKKCCKSEVG